MRRRGAARGRGLKSLLVAALVAAQIGASAAPARAAEIVASDPPGSHRTGTFVGARFRLPLDGERRQPRATLTAAPTLHSVQPTGERRLSIGNDVEFGVEGEELRSDLAGQPVSRLIDGGDSPGGPRSNISTVGWVAIGVGILVVATFALFESCRAGDICGSDRED